jgi:hypothetical protein
MPADVYATADPGPRSRRILVITDRPERFRACPGVMAVKPLSPILGVRIDRWFIDGVIEVTPVVWEWLRLCVRGSVRTR